MEYVNLTKEIMIDLIRELMEEQRIDPQDFQEISLNYATDEEIMAYTQHFGHFQGCSDFEDLEIDNGSTRRKAIVDSLYSGTYDYDGLTSIPIIFQIWDKEKIIEFCEKENISYIFTKEFICDPDNNFMSIPMKVYVELGTASDFWVDYYRSKTNESGNGT